MTDADQPNVEMDPSGSIFSNRKKSKWDHAEILDLTDYKTVKESTTENTIQIWTKRFFVFVILIVSTAASSIQLWTFPRVVRYLNPHIPIGDKPGEERACTNDATPPIGDNIDNDCFDKMLNPVYSRFGFLMMWSFLIPELLCILKSIYFIAFKKCGRPTWGVLGHHCLVEVLFTLGSTGFTFFAAPYMPKTAIVVLSIYPVTVPLFLNLTVNNKKFRDGWTLFAWMEDQMEKRFTDYGLVQSILLVLRLFMIVCYLLGIVLLIPPGHVIWPPDYLLTPPCPREAPLVSFVTVTALVFMSLPAWPNFAMVSGYITLRSKSFHFRGFTDYLQVKRMDKMESKELHPKGYEWAVFIASLCKIGIIYSVYVCIIVTSNGRIQIPTHLFGCSDARFLTGLFFEQDLTWIIFIVSTVVSSYSAKLAVRVNIQFFGFYIPSLLSIIIAFVTSDMQNTDGAWITYLASFILGFLTFILLTTHLCSDDYGLYQLERNLFIDFGYRPLFTPVFSIMNRCLLDLDDEWKNIRLKTAEDDQERLPERIANGFKRIWSQVCGKQDTEGANDQDTSRIKRKNFRQKLMRNSFERSTRWFKGQQVPMIYICTTLWHEEDFEMATLVRSVLKLMKHAKLRRERADQSTVHDKDYYDLEMHIFFDNVFDETEHRRPRKTDNLFQEDTSDRAWEDDYLEWKILNKYVVQFHEELKKGLRLFHDQDIFNVMHALSTGKIIVTPYGGRIEYTIAGTSMVVHLKDADKVQKGKRWSQVMYLYYLIGWKIDACQEMMNQQVLEKEKCFVLALDGDVDFDPPALDLVLNRLSRNDHVAACCGQIHPTGHGYLVLYQRFEYAVGHWLQKTTEHVLGCVLCSPGCFSLMRIANLAQANVMAMYKSTASTPLQKLQYDQGEDRWLCTLMLTAGGRIEFEASSHCNTFAPEDLDTFYKQRRRWGPSTTANVWEMIKNQQEARRNNAYISMPYVIYHFLMLTLSVIGVSTTIMMVAEALYISLGYNMSKIICYVIVLVPISLFTIACLMSNDQKLQLNMAKWFSLAFSFIMATVLIGIVMEGVNCPLAPSFLFFMILVGINVTAAILHFDITTLFCGLIYFLFIPSCFIFLQIYSIANLNDVSWGTRQGTKDVKQDDRSFFQKLFGSAADEKVNKDAINDEQGLSCSCILCPKMLRPKTPPPSPKQQRRKRLTSTVSSLKLVKGDTQEITEVIQEVVNEELPDELLDEAIEDYPPQTLETLLLDDLNDENIDQECDFGGVTVKELRRTGCLDWTKKLTNFTEDEADLLEKCQREHRKPTDSKIYKKSYLGRREVHNFRTNNINYLSWILSAKSPFHRNCRVHILSNPEYDFWNKMTNPDTGYIGITTKGKNKDEIRKTEKRVQKELDAFRTEKFMYFIFINALWVVISAIVLLYTDQLLSITITIPSDIANCGDMDDKEETSPVTPYNITDGTPNVTELSFQPFSLFFLVFYIVLIVTQFFCMLWHRLSTFYHYVANINIKEQQETIERKKKFNSASRRNSVIPKGRDEPVHHFIANKNGDFVDISKFQETSDSMVAKKSTIRFEEENYSDEEERLQRVSAIKSNRKSKFPKKQNHEAAVIEITEASPVILPRARPNGVGVVNDSFHIEEDVSHTKSTFERKLSVAPSHESSKSQNENIHKVNPDSIPSIEITAHVESQNLENEVRLNRKQNRKLKRFKRIDDGSIEDR